MYRNGIRAGTQNFLNSLWGAREAGVGKSMAKFGNKKRSNFYARTIPLDFRDKNRTFESTVFILQWHVPLNNSVLCNTRLFFFCFVKLADSQI